MHNNSDLDALCSAFAISSLLPNSIIATPDDLKKDARNFASNFGIKIYNFQELKKENYDGLIVVDCSTYNLVKGAEKWKTLLVIDHHQPPNEAEKIKSEFYLTDPLCPATSQLVAKNLSLIDERVAFALAVGIIADTARFKGGNAETFEILGKLLNISKKQYYEALNFAEPELDIEEKIYILSSLKNSNYLVYSNYVIAFAIVNGNESDISSSLSEFADIAFAVSWINEENVSKVSARARKHVQIKLNEVMNELGTKLNGNGGGHAKAAGASVKERPEKVISECIEILKDKIDELMVNK